MKIAAVFAVLGVLMVGCGIAHKHCDSPQVCASTHAGGDFCTTSCNGLDGGGCPAGQVCTTAGPCCGTGEACPAIVLFVCCAADGGCR